MLRCWAAQDTRIPNQVLPTAFVAPTPSVQRRPQGRAGGLELGEGDPNVLPPSRHRHRHDSSSFPRLAQLLLAEKEGCCKFSGAFGEKTVVLHR